MLTFDKLKIVVPIGAITLIDQNRFETTTKDGRVTALHYYQSTPYLLKLKLDYVDKEAVLEFTGKILLKDYPKLISKETIERCFQHIESWGLVKFDMDALMTFAEVVKCDVTKDIPVEDMNNAAEYIRSHITSYQKYVCRKLRNGSIIIEKNVVTKESKKRMTIYDKGAEMLRPSQRKFTKSYGLDNAYIGLCRFEINLNSKEQIRQSLNVRNTNLMTVMASDANPILEFLDVVVKSQEVPEQINDRKKYVAMLVLKDNDLDLSKVEARMRGFYKSHGTSISKIMEPFRQVLDIMNNQAGHSFWGSIRQQLS